jgi:hypothetical protein
MPSSERSSLDRRGEARRSRSRHPGRARRTRTREALLDPPRAASRYGYGNLVLEQVARDAGLTLRDRSSRALRVTVTTDERSPE